MIWVMPIGGKGLRTQSLGEFKPFVEIRGRKLISWVICSIKDKITPNDSFIFITTEYFAEKFNVKTEIENILHSYNLFNDCFLFTHPGFLPGASLDVYEAKEKLLTGEPVTVLNCDQYIDFQMPSRIAPKTGYMVVCANFQNEYSFVKVKKGLIEKVVEKKNISNLASTGVFIISEGRALVKAIEKQILQKLTFNGEFRLTPVINYLIEDRFSIFPLQALSFYDIGNVSKIDYFSKTSLAVSFDNESVVKDAFSSLRSPVTLSSLAI